MQINIVSCKTEEDYNEIIELLKERYNPDKSIDILDEAGSLVSYNKRKIVTLIIQDIRRKKWDFDVLDFIVLINLLKGINIKKLKN